MKNYKCEYIKKKGVNRHTIIYGGDIIAGWFFRQFIKDYKEYDAQQKKTISELQNRVRELEYQQNHMKAAVGSGEAGMLHQLNTEIKSAYRVRTELDKVNAQNEMQKKKIDRLTDIVEHLRKKLRKKKIQFDESEEFNDIINNNIV